MMPRPFNALIIASVSLNLLLLAIIGGHVWKHLSGSYLYRPLKEIVRTLPADKHDAFESVISTAEENTRVAHRELWQAREKAADIMTAPSFDRAAYMAQVKKIQELQTQITLRMSDAIAAIATQCGPGDRAKLAALVRHPPRPPHKAKPAK